MSHNIFFHATVVRRYRRGLHRGKFEWDMPAKEPPSMPQDRACNERSNNFLGDPAAG